MPPNAAASCSCCRHTSVIVAACSSSSRCWAVLGDDEQPCQDHRDGLTCLPLGRAQLLQPGGAPPLLQPRAASPGRLSQRKPQAPAALLAQLDRLGWDRVEQLAPDLAGFTLRLRDAAGRVHRASVRLPAGFPQAPPAVEAALPRAWRPHWLPGYTLEQLATQLEQVLDSYQPLWEQLDDLDASAQLLDPPQARAAHYASATRVVALGGGCSCQLSLAPAAPRALPRATFNGPSSAVAALQAAWYGRAAAVWDAQRRVCDNLEGVLQVRLPAPKRGGRAAGEGEHEGSDGDDSDAEDPGACQICYALHLPNPARPDELGDAPGVTCPSPGCGRLFHVLCLAEWLGSLPTSRRVFDTMFGTCPFCSGPIGVSTRGAGAAWS